MATTVKDETKTGTENKPVSSGFQITSTQPEQTQQVQPQQEQPVPQVEQPTPQQPVTQQQAVTTAVTPSSVGQSQYAWMNNLLNQMSGQNNFTAYMQQLQQGFVPTAQQQYQTGVGGVPTNPAGPADQSAGTPAATPQTGSTTGTTVTKKVTYTPPQFKEAEYAPDFKPLLDDWAAAAREQQINTIDYGTNRGVEELQRAQEDAKQNFQTMRNQVAANEQKALDNQALYAEARGDKGGIGAAQYAAIQNTAAINTLAVNQQQTKLATDTARQIADLRAQGEYKKADALLSITQNYLSQLLSLKQWALSFNLSVDEFNNSLKQWEVNYEMQVAQLTGEYRGVPTYAAQQDQLERLSKSGYALLQAGVLPSAEQLAAMGMTQQEAYYWMQGSGIRQIYGNLSGIPGATGMGGIFGYGGYGGGSGGGSYSGGSSSSTSSSSSSSSKSSGSGGVSYTNGGLDSSMIKTIQKEIGANPDGVWGPESSAKFAEDFGVTVTSAADAAKVYEAYYEYQSHLGGRH